MPIRSVTVTSATLGAMSDKKLLRLSRHRMLGGVCAGFAEYYDIEPLFVRLLYIVTTAASAVVPGIVIYLVLWALMRPAEGTPTDAGAGSGSP